MYIDHWVIVKCMFGAFDAFDDMFKEININ